MLRAPRGSWERRFVRTGENWRLGLCAGPAPGGSRSERLQLRDSPEGVLEGCSPEAAFRLVTCPRMLLLFPSSALFVACAPSVLVCSSALRRAALRRLRLTLARVVVGLRGIAGLRYQGERLRYNAVQCKQRLCSVVVWQSIIVAPAMRSPQRRPSIQHDTIR